MLAALRTDRGGHTREHLLGLWDDQTQAARCLTSLLDDGLARTDGVLVTL